MLLIRLDGCDKLVWISHFDRAHNARVPVLVSVEQREGGYGFYRKAGSFFSL